MTGQYVGGLIFAGFGLALTLYSLVACYYSIRANRWQSADGQIIAARVEVSGDVEGGNSYRPQISYSYHVGGQQFRSTRTRFGDWHWYILGRNADRIRQRYYRGLAVTVLYDPAEPSEAVLEPGISVVLVIELLAGVALLVLGLLSARAV